MGAVGGDAHGTVFLQGFGSTAQGAGGVDHVVHQQAAAAGNFTDDVHHLGDVGLLAALVDDGQFAIQPFGQGAGTHDTTNVRGHHHGVFQLALGDVGQQDGGGVDVVDRDVEEALDLVGVQVHGEDAVDTGDLQHVGHDLGADGHARGAHAAVLTGIAEIGNDGGDAACRGATQGVDEDQQLHQVVVGGRTGGLDDEGILATDVFQDLDVDFAVGETTDDGLAQGDTQVSGDV